MKRIITFLIAFAMLFSMSLITLAEESGINIVINGEKITTDVAPREMPVYNNGEYVGDRVMVPIRAISEALNCDVYWEDSSKSIIIYRNNKLFILWEQLDTAFCMDGITIRGSYTMDVPPTVIEGRTLVPVRAVTELMGAKVEWLSDSNTVDIKYELGALEENTGVAEQCAVYGILVKQQYDVCKSYVNGTIDSIKGEMVLTNEKVIKFELFPQFAPETVARFAGLAKAGIYNGTIFHRVIKDFVAQGGGFTEDGSVSALTPVKGEFALNGILNLLPHERGTLSLARANDYNSGTSQFFICHQDCMPLDGSYAAFGRVTEGMEVVDEICNSETDENDRPKTDFVIKEIKVLD